MAATWERLFDDLPDGAGALKEELRAFLAAAQEDSNMFLRRQGDKLELYLNQLAEDAITTEQFDGYVRDVQDLTKVQSLKMSVAAKARAQRFVKGISKLVIKGLLASL